MILHCQFEMGMLAEGKMMRVLQMSSGIAKHHLSVKFPKSVAGVGGVPTVDRCLENVLVGEGDSGLGYCVGDSQAC